MAAESKNSQTETEIGNRMENMSREMQNSHDGRKYGKEYGCLKPKWPHLHHLVLYWVTADPVLNPQILYTPSENTDLPVLTVWTENIP